MKLMSGYHVHTAYLWSQGRGPNTIVIHPFTISKVIVPNHIFFMTKIMGKMNIGCSNNSAAPMADSIHTGTYGCWATSAWGTNWAGHSFLTKLTLIGHVPPVQLCCVPPGDTGSIARQHVRFVSLSFVHAEQPQMASTPPPNVAKLC